jgi:polysaccharide deacetylase 2 family uncharacterized protein YibQ
MAEVAASWMDRNLDDLWGNFGILDANVQRASLLSQESEGERWDLRVIEIELPADLAIDQLAEALDRLSEVEGYPIQVLWMKEVLNLRAADIWVDGFLTHRIILRKPPEKPEILVTEPRRPQLALIVDDLGNTFEPIRPLFQNHTPFTVSIFPRRPFSRRIAEEARSRGLEVMMHLPMEPWGYPEKNPGAGALLIKMSGQDLERVLLQDIQDLPHVKGVNNHMGSRFTEDRGRMARIMRILASRGLYFLDSLTTPRSVGYRLAREMGMSAYRRDVFLDVVQDEDFIRSQFQTLLRVAKLQGHAVGICHPYPETVRMLPKFFEQGEERGFEWVTVSQLDSAGLESTKQDPSAYR